MKTQKATFTTLAPSVGSQSEAVGALKTKTSCSAQLGAVESLPPRTIKGSSPAQARAVHAAQTAKGYLKAFAAVLALTIPACSTMESKHTVNVSSQSILADQRRHDAELREEAYGPRIAPGDYRRMLAAVSAAKNREQQELAMYAKFQSDRKFALAQASSPRMLISNGSDLPVDYRQMDRAAMREYRQVAYTPATSRVGRSSAGQEADYPARFYKRELQENSVAQAQAEYNENARAVQVGDQQATGEDTPYAVPVPGRPGFVTMPPKMGGYIDVRGYNPGSYVMDPWTKTVIRVP